MKRGGPLKRSPLSRQPVKRLRYRDAEAMQSHIERHESCACCWRHSRQWGVKLSRHHMLPGRKCRVDAEWNLLTLCTELDGTGCHERLQHGRENLAVCMRLKLQAGGYDRRAMAAWMKRFTNGYGGEKLPRMAARLPDWILQLRRDGGWLN